MYTDVNVLRADLVAIGRRAADRGLVVGPGGNTSGRLTPPGGPPRIYLKASGKCFEDAGPADYVGVDPATGAVVDGALKPTCELPLHLRYYSRRPDIHAIVHTHAPLSIAFAMLGRPLRAFTPDMVALVGREVPVVPYVQPAGPELADAVDPFMAANAILFANHGLITVGGTLREAYFRTLVVEDAVQTVVAAATLGKLRELTDAEAAFIDGMEAEAYRRKMLARQA